MTTLLLPATLLLAALPLGLPPAPPDLDAALVARARRAEAQQLQALAAHPVRLEASGQGARGPIAWTREISYQPDGSVQARQVRGTESATGGKSELSLLSRLTLAPFSDPRARIELSQRPTEGLARLRVVPPDAGPVAAVVVEIDVGTGLKRALEVELGALRAGTVLSSRIRFVFAADGAPASFEAKVEIRQLWSTRSIDVRAKRLVEKEAP